VKPVDVAAITKANATIDALCERFPRTFFRDVASRKPLKLGIHLDLAFALNGEINSLDIRAALVLYTSSTRYRHALQAGAPRLDLDGNAAGEVSTKHAEIAKQQLTKRKPTSTPRPARDGLATLKAAAALRRQQAGDPK
jgi:ProP effector